MSYQANPFGRGTAPLPSFGAALAVLAVFSLLPALAVLGLSFTDITSVLNVPVHFVGLDNYARFFSPAQLGDNLRATEHTLVFAIGVTVVQNVLALLVAIALNATRRGTTLWRAIVFLPVVLGVTVTGLIFQLVFNPGAGPAASVWSWFGASSAFFGDPSLALALVIAAQIWMTLGYATVIYLAGLQAVPAELYEAADIDGASGWGKFRNVTVPMLAPSVTANVLISVIGALQAYQLAYVLTGVQNQATTMLSLQVFYQGFQSGANEQGYASAISMIQFVIVAVVALTALAVLRRRETQL